MFRVVLLIATLVVLWECAAGSFELPWWTQPSECLETVRTEVLVPFFRFLGVSWLYLCNWPGRLLDVLTILKRLLGPVPFAHCAWRVFSSLGRLLFSWISVFQSALEVLFRMLNGPTDGFAIFSAVFTCVVWSFTVVGVIVGLSTF
jgi:hypothetical protein